MNYSLELNMLSTISCPARRVAPGVQGRASSGGRTIQELTVQRHTIIRDLVVVPLVAAGIASAGVILAILNALGVTA